MPVYFYKAKDFRGTVALSVILTKVKNLSFFLITND